MAKKGSRKGLGLDSPSSRFKTVCYWMQFNQGVNEMETITYRTDDFWVTVTRNNLRKEFVLAYGKAGEKLPFRTVISGYEIFKTWDDAVRQAEWFLIKYSKVKA